MIILFSEFSVFSVKNETEFERNIIGSKTKIEPADPLFSSLAPQQCPP